MPHRIQVPRTHAGFVTSLHIHVPCADRPQMQCALSRYVHMKCGALYFLYPCNSHRFDRIEPFTGHCSAAEVHSHLNLLIDFRHRSAAVLHLDTIAASSILMVIHSCCAASLLLLLLPTPLLLKALYHRITVVSRNNAQTG